jgi:FtsZ-binding cell division protein ZapB
MSSPDKKDRIIRLESENNTLKEKENILQSEITKMQTKLRRIDGLLRSRSAIGGDSGYDSHDLQRDLQNEFDQLKTQNDISKEKVRKLLVI